VRLPNACKTRPTVAGMVALTESGEWQIREWGNLRKCQAIALLAKPWYCASLLSLHTTMGWPRLHGPRAHSIASHTFCIHYNYFGLCICCIAPIHFAVIELWSHSTLFHSKLSILAKRPQLNLICTNCCLIGPTDQSRWFAIDRPSQLNNN
jgi:hypothetical protein